MVQAGLMAPPLKPKSAKGKLSYAPWPPRTGAGALRLAGWRFLNIGSRSLTLTARLAGLLGWRFLPFPCHGGARQFGQAPGGGA